MEPMDWLQSRRQQLEDAKTQAERILKDECNDSLVITRRNNKYYYSVRQKGQTAKHYLSLNQLAKASAIANYDYATQVYQCAEKELSLIDRYLSFRQSSTAFDSYDLLHPMRKALVTPILVSDDAYADNWLQSKASISNSIPVPIGFFTDNEEYVRSKSELIIANTLKQFNIPYKYEEPVLLNHKHYFPDFTILRKSTREVCYWEHFGIIDNPEYQLQMLQKLNCYTEHGIVFGKNLIATFESKEIPLSTKTVKALIRENFVCK